MSSADPTHPEHYAGLSPEPGDVAEAWGLGFWKGSAVKYIARAGRKGPEEEDLLKAIGCLERRLKAVRWKP